LSCFGYVESCLHGLGVVVVVFMVCWGFVSSYL
jgi:hypothetical protein